MYPLILIGTNTTTCTSTPDCSRLRMVKRPYSHWGKADDRNCIYGHPKMADVESGKNLFCRWDTGGTVGDIVGLTIDKL